LVTKKRILITAGPTWVAIDKARVISNIASGETGFILAEKFKKANFSVTLLLGPGYYSKKIRGVKVIHFKFYVQLAKLLKNELRKYKYTGLIHAAAVADYQPKRVISGKIDSNLKKININLVPTKKLINDFKKNYPNLFTVGFKFEPNTDRDNLVSKGRVLLKQATLDLVVANSDKNELYQAYILDKENKYGPFLSKAKMASYLSNLVEKKL